MNDPISRQAAIDVVKRLMGDSELSRTVQTGLDILPSAQPEIVRCKDCFMHGVCRFEQYLGLDGYCSKAERRTDGR